MICISGCQLEQKENREWLQRGLSLCRLKTVRLYLCGLETVPLKLEAQKNTLEHLTLFGNNLKILPVFLCEFESLKYIDIRSNENMHRFLVKASTETLTWWTRRTILSKSPSERSEELAKQLLNKLQHFSKMIDIDVPTRVILLGFGCAGKTSLLKSLNKPARTGGDQQVVNIDLRDRTEGIEYLEDGDFCPGEVVFLDPGGQRAYHATHEMIVIPRRTVFVIVSRVFCKLEDKEKQILGSCGSDELDLECLSLPSRNQFEYWLSMIRRTLAEDVQIGKESTKPVVFLVLSHCDQLLAIPSGNEKLKEELKDVIDMMRTQQHAFEFVCMEDSSNRVNRPYLLDCRDRRELEFQYFGVELERRVRAMYTMKESVPAVFQSLFKKKDSPLENRHVISIPELMKSLPDQPPDLILTVVKFEDTMRRKIHVKQAGSGGWLILDPLWLMSTVLPAFFSCRPSTEGGMTNRGLIARHRDVGEIHVDVSTAVQPTTLTAADASILFTTEEISRLMGRDEVQDGNVNVLDTLSLSADELECLWELLVLKNLCVPLQSDGQQLYLLPHQLPHQRPDGAWDASVREWPHVGRLIRPSAGHKFLSGLLLRFMSVSISEWITKEYKGFQHVWRDGCECFIL